jgi:hypothetical protein
MNATDLPREARSRNLARLRKLTIGTAALGVAATSGFGWLAAMTYAGATTTATTTAYTTASGATTTSTMTSTSAASSSSPVSSAVSAPAVTSSSGFGHVTSGGS